MGLRRLGAGSHTRPRVVHASPGEWDWPEFRRLWERLGERFTVVRYDGRGIGLSTRSSDVELTEESRQLDLQAGIDATGA